jgi:tryptophanyl-tRNA synthetase
MSKSDNQEMSCINLCDPPDAIVKKVQRAVTDCISLVSYEPEERPGVSNLVAVYAAMSGLSHEQVCAAFEGKQTVDFKRALGELLVEGLTPIRERTLELEADPGYVDEVLRQGAERAKVIAEENLVGVKRKIGLIGPLPVNISAANQTSAGL